MSEIKEQSEPISRIAEGTVIDHIPAGMAARVWMLLKLEKHKKRIYVGLNLHSTTMKEKDLIKIEERMLQPEEANHIAIFAPDATISIIENFEIKEKFQVSLPDIIHGYLKCPNSRCISNFEGAITSFNLSQIGTQTHLSCRYCQKTFTQNDLIL